MTSEESSPVASSSEGMSSNTQFSNSTPLKKYSRSGPRLSTTLERAFIDDPEVDPHFIDNFFVPLGTIPNLDDDSITQSIKAIISARKEVDMYGDIVNIFTKIAQHVSANGNGQPLHFFCSFTKSPSAKNHQHTRHIAPDILVLPPLAVSEPFLQKTKSQDVNSPQDSFRCPWSILESMVEVKPKREWKMRQSVDYLQTILQHRPDKVSMLGITCNQTGYRFYYVDACTQKTSVSFRWDDGLEKLVHYVYSLHEIYIEDLGRDTSIRLHDIVWKDTYNSAIWQISFKGEDYRMQPIFERRGTGRRTWIAVGTANNANDDKNAPSVIRVVKDMWRDNSRRYEEGNLLQLIHENGYIPGIVRPIADGILSELTAGNRTKHRLVMASTGLRLSACKSVLDFFKVIYDAIEAHEKVVERGVLHRDISWYNVLCNPCHYIGNDSGVDHPNIGKILREPNSQPLCLLTDFDNAALVQDDENPSEGTKRTGTPMFMACELVYGSTGYDILQSSKPGPSITLSQFCLEDDVLEKYARVYGQKRYDEFNALLSSVISGKPEVDPFATDSLFHQPHHDIESIYWIILWFLAKAWPTGTDPYPSVNKIYQKELLETIHSRMTLGHRPNGVLDLLIYGERRWRVSLHSAYQSLAKMLSDMGDYLCMCWSRFPDMPYWHSHEAFKRLLLKEIVRMTRDDTPIPIQGPRPPTIPTPAQVALKSISKYETSQCSTPSGSRSGTVGSTNSKQSGRTKRPRSNSISANSGTATKKQRSSVFHEHATTASSDVAAGNVSNLVQICLENIEDDDKLWFSL